MNNDYVLSDKWNPYVQSTLTHIIERGAHQNNFAVFDFDNTILCRDIGEPVMGILAYQNKLVREQISPGLGDGSFYAKRQPARALNESESIAEHYNSYLAWADTQKDYQTHYADTYAWLLKIKAGLTPLEITEATHAAYCGGRDINTLDSGGGVNDQELVEHTPFFRPRLYPGMLELLQLLLSSGYKIWIVSASPVWTIRWMVKNILNPALIANGAEQRIDLSAVYGMSCLLRDKNNSLWTDRQLAETNPDYLELKPEVLKQYVLSDQLSYPLTCYSGKRKIVETICPSGPYLVAGDSENDLEMLTSAKYRLWVARTDRTAALKRVFTYSAAHSPENWFYQLVDIGSTPGFRSEDPRHSLNIGEARL